MYDPKIVFNLTKNLGRQLVELSGGCGYEGCLLNLSVPPKSIIEYVFAHARIVLRELELMYIPCSFICSIYYSNAVFVLLTKHCYFDASVASALAELASEKSTFEICSC